MTVRYEYKCGKCGFVYIEQRPANEEQIYKVCYVCKEGDFLEESSEVLSLEAERNPASVLPVEEPSTMPLTTLSEESPT